MKRNFYFAIFLFAQIAFSQSSSSEQWRLFAHLQNQAIVYDIDPNNLKSSVARELFKDDPINFKIDVHEKVSLNSDDRFYYVEIVRINDNSKTVRILRKEKNQLFLIEKYEGENLFEQYFKTCQGPENCEPNILKIDDRFYWTCGESTDLKCLTPEQAKLNTCKSWTSLLMEE